MNLPNRITLFRICLVPIIMIVYAVVPKNQSVFYPSLSLANFLILILFFIGAISDFIDGQIARKRNLVTNFGKFLDPLADKLLIMSVLLILMDQNAYYGTNFIEWWMVIIIFAREFMVTGLRLIAVQDRKVIAASWYGKIKTTVQFLTLIVLLLGSARTKINGEMIVLSTFYVIVAKVFIFAMLAITIFSGIDYINKNKEVLFSESKNKKKYKKEKEV